MSLLKIESSNRVSPAVKIVLIYIIFSGLWILFTDKIILLFAQSPEILTEIQTIKGLFFILATAAIIFFLLKHYIKEAEEKSREQSYLTERFDILCRHTNDALLFVNAEGNIFEANERASKLYGYPPEDLMNIEIFSLFTDEEVDKIKQKLTETNDQSPLFESIQKTRLGAEFPVEISRRYFKHNNKSYYQFIIRDISERKKSYVRIVKLVRVYSVLSSINQLIIKNPRKGELFVELCRISVEKGDYRMAWIGEADKLTKKIKVSAKYGKVEGFFDSFTFYLDKNSEFFGPTAKVIINGDYFIVNDIANDERNPLWKTEALKRDYKSAAFFPLVTNNEVTGIIGFFSDQTNYFVADEIDLLKEMANDISYAILHLSIEEQKREAEEAVKKSERKLSTLMSNLPGMAYRCMNNKNWTMEFVSEGTFRLTGYHPYELINDSVVSYASLIHRDDEQYVWDQVESALKNDRAFQLVYRIITRDGELKWVWEQGRGIKGSSGIEAIEGFITDITPQKKAEEELVVAKEKAEESDKLKTEFLTIISHEIRTPLNVILSHASLIEDEIQSVITDDIQYSFKSIESSGRRLVRTINLMLNMASFETGRFEPTLTKFSLKELLHGLYREFTATASTKNLDLDISAETEGDMIVSDKYMVGEIFQNLIDNAIKYTREGKVSIVEYKRGNDKIAVDIIDTGIGISEDYLPFLFTPFTQEESGYSRGYEGNGLGLALVKKFSELIDMSLEVKSKKDVGTTITVVFN